MNKKHYYVVSKFDATHGADTYVTPSSLLLGVGRGEMGLLGRSDILSEAHKFDEMADASACAENLNGKAVLIFRADMYQRCMMNFEHP